MRFLSRGKLRQVLAPDPEGWDLTTCRHTLWQWIFVSSSQPGDENHRTLQKESASVGPPQWEHLLSVLCIRPDREGGSVSAWCLHVAMELKSFSV